MLLFSSLTLVFLSDVSVYRITVLLPDFLYRCDACSLTLKSFDRVWLRTEHRKLCEPLEDELESLEEVT
jgi:hypothetical protein